ncbi:hypothetical protein HYS54_04930 [Candidatus Micrarchaeota archaeon]|nr:hypothetical protein [Candidatus Micrarchaeota archaeon]
MTRRTAVHRAGRRVIAAAGGLNEREYTEARRRGFYPARLTLQDVRNFRRQAEQIRQRLRRIEEEKTELWLALERRIQEDFRKPIKTIPDEQAFLAYGRRFRKFVRKHQPEAGLKARDKAAGAYIRTMETTPTWVRMVGEAHHPTSVTITKEITGRVLPEEAAENVRRAKAVSKRESITNAVRVLKDDLAQREMGIRDAERASKEFNRLSGEIDKAVKEEARQLELARTMGWRERRSRKSEMMERTRRLDQRISRMTQGLEYLFYRLEALAKKNGIILNVKQGSHEWTLKP